MDVFNFRSHHSSGHWGPRSVGKASTAPVVVSSFFRLPLVGACALVRGYVPSPFWICLGGFRWCLEALFSGRILVGWHPFFKCVLLYFPCVVHEFYFIGILLWISLSIVVGVDALSKKWECGIWLPILSASATISEVTSALSDPFRIQSQLDLCSCQLYDHLK